MIPILLGLTITLASSAAFAKTVYSVGITYIEDMVTKEKIKADTVAETVGDGKIYTTISYLRNPKTKKVEVQKMVITDHSPSEATLEFTDPSGHQIIFPMDRSVANGTVTLAGQLAIPQNRRLDLKVVLTENKRDSFTTLFTSDNKMLKRTINSSLTVHNVQFQQAKEKLYVGQVVPTP